MINNNSDKISDILKYNNVLASYDKIYTIIDYLAIINNKFFNIDTSLLSIKNSSKYEINCETLIKHNLIFGNKEHDILKFIKKYNLKENIDYKIFYNDFLKNGIKDYKFTSTIFKKCLLKEKDYSDYLTLMENILFLYTNYQNLILPNINNINNLIEKYDKMLDGVTKLIEINNDANEVISKSNDTIKKYTLVLESVENYMVDTYDSINYVKVKVNNISTKKSKKGLFSRIFSRNR